MCIQGNKLKVVASWRGKQNQKYVEKYYYSREVLGKRFREGLLYTMQTHSKPFHMYWAKYNVDYCKRFSFEKG